MTAISCGNRSQWELQLVKRSNVEVLNQRCCFRVLSLRDVLVYYCKGKGLAKSRSLDVSDETLAALK